MHRTSILPIVLLLCVQIAKAQLPKTELYLINLKRENGSIFLGKAQKISAQPGYNNQPSFSLDEKTIYFSSAASSGQTDIWNFDLRSGEKRQVTKTGISEYSPQEITSGQLFAVVVEIDSSQNIHRIEAASGLHNKVLNLDSVGYFCFLNSDSVVYYKLTDPHSLRVFSISGNSEVWLGDWPARGFRPLNRHALLYARKDSSITELMIYDFALQKSKTICLSPVESEDFIWHAQLGILRSEKSKLFRWNEITSNWDLFLDLSPLGFKSISRFALDKKLKHLVLVNKSEE